MHILGHCRLTIASLACSLLALISHSAAMSLAATAARAIARRQKLGDQVERLSVIGAFDLVAWGAAAVALVLAFIAARREAPRMRTFAFAAALIANLWNVVVA